jgi:hypothetical protein
MQCAATSSHQQTDQENDQVCRAEGASRSMALVVLASLLMALALVGTSPVSADVIVPIVAHLNGAQKSVWRSDVKLYNSTDKPVTVSITATPRGQLARTSDGITSRTVAAGQLLVLEDVESILHGEGTWADRLRLHFTDADGAPVGNLLVRATVYEEAAPGNEFGTCVQTFDPDADPTQAPTDGYSPLGTILGTVLGKANERDGIIVSTGPNGATVKWIYKNSARTSTTAGIVTYGADMTFQYTGGVAELLGFTPDPNGTLSATVAIGSARVAVTHNNNTTNCPNWDQMTPIPRSAGPRILGIDWNHDGVVDDPVDESGDVVIPIGVSCSAPFPWEGWLLVEPKGSYSYFADSMPQGMGLAQGSGQIVYMPPCSTFGSSYIAGFTASDGRSTASPISVVFRVLR